MRWTLHLKLKLDGIKIVKKFLEKSLKAKLPSGLK